MNKINERNNKILNIVCQIFLILIILTLLIGVYVKLNNPLILNLFVLVPIIELYICRLFKIKIEYKTILNLLIGNIVIILIFSIIFIPIMLIINSNLEFKFDTIKNLLLNRKIGLRIFQDIFTIIISSLLGLYIDYLIVKRNNMFGIKGVKLFSSNIKEKQDFKEKAIKIIKPYFIQNNAIDIDNAQVLDVLKINFKFNKTIKNYWNYLVNLKIIKGKNNRYYYDENNENNINEKFKLWHKITIAIIITIVISFFTSVIFNLEINKQIRNISNNTLSFNISSSWNTSKEDFSKNLWEFYKIIEDENENKNEESNSNKNIARILIEYDSKKDDEKANKSIEAIRETLEIYLANFYKKEDYKINAYISKKNCGIVEVKLKQNNYNEYNYYIYKNGKMAIITAMINTDKENVLKELEKESKEIAESFYWK